MKINIKKSFLKLSKTRILLVFLVLVIAICGPVQTIIQNVYATPSISELQSQIDALEQSKAKYNAEIVRLNGETQTLQSTLDGLANEKAAIQAQINIAQAKYDQLVLQIADTEKKIKDNQDALGKTLADLYIDDKITPIEMLFSSKNISDYMDKQEYRNSVSNELTSTIAKVKELKNSLEVQKTSSGAVLNDQKNQRQLLANKEAESQSILDYTKGQQSAYAGLVAKNNTQEDALRAQQRALIIAEEGSSGGQISSGYPYLNKSMNYNDHCRYSDGTIGADPWGYCYRQCTSYVAWKLANDGKGNSGFSYLHNANQWGDNGNGVYSDIQRGDVIVYFGGYYGHVMYVESVSDTMVYYSQANVIPGMVSDGQMTVSKIFNGNYAVRRFH